MEESQARQSSLQGTQPLVGSQKGSAWAQPFPLCDFRSPSRVNQSSSARRGERLELVGCFSANHLLRAVCGQTVLALHE